MDYFIASTMWALFLAIGVTLGYQLGVRNKPTYTTVIQLSANEHMLLYKHRKALKEAEKKKERARLKAEAAKLALEISAEAKEKKLIEESQQIGSEIKGFR